MKIKHLEKSLLGNSIILTDQNGNPGFYEPKSLLPFLIGTNSSLGVDTEGKLSVSVIKVGLVKLDGSIVAYDSLNQAISNAVAGEKVFLNKDLTQDVFNSVNMNKIVCKNGVDIYGNGFSLTSNLNEPIIECGSNISCNIYGFDSIANTYNDGSTTGAVINITGNQNSLFINAFKFSTETGFILNSNTSFGNTISIHANSIVRNGGDTSGDGNILNGLFFLTGSQTTKSIFNICSDQIIVKGLTSLLGLGQNAEIYITSRNITLENGFVTNGQGTNSNIFFRNTRLKANGHCFNPNLISSYSTSTIFKGNLTLTSSYFEFLGSPSNDRGFQTPYNGSTSATFAFFNSIINIEGETVIKSPSNKIYSVYSTTAQSGYIVLNGGSLALTEEIYKDVSVKGSGSIKMTSLDNIDITVFKSKNSKNSTSVDFFTIQSAIDYSKTGDLIEVNSNLVLSGVPIIIKNDVDIDFNFFDISQTAGDIFKVSSSDANVSIFNVKNVTHTESSSTQGALVNVSNDNCNISISLKQYTAERAALCNISKTLTNNKVNIKVLDSVKINGVLFAGLVNSYISEKDYNDSSPMDVNLVNNIGSVNLFVKHMYPNGSESKTITLLPGTSINVYSNPGDGPSVSGGVFNTNYTIQSISVNSPQTIFDKFKIFNYVKIESKEIYISGGKLLDSSGFTETIFKVDKIFGYSDSYLWSFGSGKIVFYDTTITLDKHIVNKVDNRSLAPSKFSAVFNGSCFIDCLSINSSLSTMPTLWLSDKNCELINKGVLGISTPYTNALENNNTGVTTPGTYNTGFINSRFNNFGVFLSNKPISLAANFIPVVGTIIEDEDISF